MTNKPRYADIAQGIDDLTKSVLDHYRARSLDLGNNSQGWAAATGLLSVLLTDAISDCPKSVQIQFMERLARRQKEYQQDTIVEKLKQ